MGCRYITNHILACPFWMTLLAYWHHHICCYWLLLLVLCCYYYSTYMYLYNSVYIYMYIYIYVWYVYAYIYIYIIHVHQYIHIYIYTHIYIYIYTHTHTHMCEVSKTLPKIGSRNPNSGETRSHCWLHTCVFIFYLYIYMVLWRHYTVFYTYVFVHIKHPIVHVQVNITMYHNAPWHTIKCDTITMIWEPRIVLNLNNDVYIYIYI